jgi:hypothetical protein
LMQGDAHERRYRSSRARFHRPAAGNRTAADARRRLLLIG